MSKPKSRNKGDPAATKSGAKWSPWRMLRANWPYLVLALVVFVLASLAREYWLAPQSPQEAFLDEAKNGQAALANVVTVPSRGHTHVPPGRTVDYGAWPPTSGDHDREPVDPGVYDQPQKPEQLVHSLEHGLIVIYVDDPGAAALDTLKAWVKLYRDPWAGIVVVPKPELGKGVVLTAWTRYLRLDPFDAPAAAAFIDAFRGRGPENPVR